MGLEWYINLPVALCKRTNSLFGTVPFTVADFAIHLSNRRHFEVSFLNAAEVGLAAT